VRFEVGYYFPLLPKLNLSVQAGWKLVITGFNGIGKSIIAKQKTLVGKFQPLQVLPPNAWQPDNTQQELVWEDSAQTPLQIISAYAPTHKGGAAAAIPLWSKKSDHVMQEIGTLSGGEQSAIAVQPPHPPRNFLF